MGSDVAHTTQTNGETMSRQDSTRTDHSKRRTLEYRSQRAYKHGALTITRSAHARKGQ